MTTYDYNEASHIERVEFPNGIVEERKYDDSNRLQTVTHSASGTTAMQLIQFFLNLFMEVFLSKIQAQ
jgi:hypothetical protein